MALTVDLRDDLMKVAYHYVKAIRGRNARWSENHEWLARRGLVTMTCVHGVDEQDVCLRCAMGVYVEAKQMALEVRAEVVERARVTVLASHVTSGLLTERSWTSLMEAMDRWVREPIDEVLREEQP